MSSDFGGGSRVTHNGRHFGGTDADAFYELMGKQFGRISFFSRLDAVLRLGPIRGRCRHRGAKLRICVHTIRRTSACECPDKMHPESTT